MLRPLIEYEQEISALANRGVRRISVPDKGLIVGESVDEGVRRMRVLIKFAKKRHVELFIRNEYGDDISAQPLNA